MTAAKKKEKEVYLLRKDSGGYRVIKLAESEETGPHVAAEYTLTREANGYRCNCPGFAHRNDCKHVFMPDNRPKGKPRSLDEARDVVRELIEAFQPVFRDVSLGEDPYERDNSGNVTSITLVLRGPLLDTCILTKGTWEGILVDSGALVRLIVS